MEGAHQPSPDLLDPARHREAELLHLRLARLQGQRPGIQGPGEGDRGVRRPDQSGSPRSDDLGRLSAASSRSCGSSTPSATTPPTPRATGSGTRCRCRRGRAARSCGRARGTSTTRRPDGYRDGESSALRALELSGWREGGSLRATSRVAGKACHPFSACGRTLRRTGDLHQGRGARLAVPAERFVEVLGSSRVARHLRHPRACASSPSAFATPAAVLWRPLEPGIHVSRHLLRSARLLRDVIGYDLDSRGGLRRGLGHGKSVDPPSRRVWSGLPPALRRRAVSFPGWVIPTST